MDLEFFFNSSNGMFVTLITINKHIHMTRRVLHALQSDSRKEMHLLQRDVL